MDELGHGALFLDHRNSGGDNLMVPARNALCSQKYKPVDYEHLYELAAEAKMASAQIQLKIKKAEQVSKISKEQMLLKQHRQVWWQEYKRLSESRQKAEEEMKTFLDEESHKSNFFFDLRELEQKLSKEWDTYQTNALVPVWQLKEDLKLKLSQVQRHLSKESCQKPKINSAEVLQQIKFLKNQQKAVLEGLILESQALERELEEYKENALEHSSEEKNGLFLEVPPELVSLECPFPDLQALMMEQYQELAGGYGTKLQEVDQQLEALSRAGAAAAEAAAAHEAEVVLADSRQKQLEICADLKAKVLQWKAQQEEAAKLEAAVAARRKEKEDERERLQREQETIRRAQDKEKLKKYWAEKELKWQEQEERDLQQLEELRKLMAEQAAKDRERVQFRRALLEKRLLQKKELALLQARQQQQKEKRLEALRQQVAIVAKLDPARAVADTVASKARMGIGAKEEFELQQPLFRLHTYSEEQVISDPRLRVELALREAGLHKTLYAREVLSKLPPPKLPRRDMESTAFKM
ncbi:coiled-coil domain-containing protein 148 isoform X3 [Molothrus ater]|uniref:coiled-coil domain-containing protein 148 isoform X3 n=1 Tax=Molothrus ater TaxID=84834 RepID=UPI0023E8ACE0|nr:coiled-coil domain-containing protein 148 isoform X3 [Molothrus ater]